ncbi:S41 family peptidase [Petrimonas mucosa]|jgi:carboxyl-terminal processing protease|uniref:S41 family peptidase n=1 Tax=Petrimonas mucosa TaxID=1642646 RepID=UPI0017795F77|nr:S41 family peptidase [Petrimonas mucosa]MDD3560094.1 S41 family peptidase [Petrimonas mucosa]HHT30769.1 PDZ domain-containing protein [Petrimonas mucosa]
MKKIPFLILILLVTTTAMGQTTQADKNKRYFDINKSIDIFNSVIRELDMFYVDSVKVDSLINSTIRTMLARMDPYTEYYAEENIKDLQFMTTGEYGGIGAIISYNDNRVVINEPYKGLPADRAGLKAGDTILQIDGSDMRKATVKEVSDKLKGMPGTSLKLRIHRPGEKKSREMKLVREKIEIDPITYADVLNDNVGYLHFSGFTNGSSDRVKETVLDLKRRGAESLVIDLRGNGGGILDEAVNVVNLFVKKGVEIVSTRGKVKQWDRSYRTQYQPIDTLMPIVVLIDTGSASASEIVAGSLQDLDRAVIIGNRSFGKGLVQTPRDLPYGGNIKITTSKYYIPSGRCIQALDYSHRNPDGSVARVPDSLTQVFRTRNGREVRDGGGIIPDYVIPQEKSGTIGYYLLANNIIFNFVTEWAMKHPTVDAPESFQLSDADYEEFKQYVKGRDFQYDQMSNRSLQSLKEIMEFEGYFSNASEEFNALKKKLQPDLDRDLELFGKEIRKMIETEIMQRYYYKEGVLMYELRDDPVLKKAREVLKNRELYDRTLQPQPERA